MAIKYKLLEKSDIILMREIIEEDGMSYMPKLLEKWLDNPNNIGFVAIADEKVVALIHGYTLERFDSKKPMYFIYSVGTLLTYRRRGIANSLLKFVLDYTKEKGFSESFVPSDYGNIAACKLYQGLGGKSHYKDEVVFVYDYEKEV